MTGPIYLVSACASGEEFVAAFRRYADKNGLFVPIGEPLPVGARGRFAVTLKDGGVMVEGEAEVITSARVPSVLHGRVGMTLRFLEPDAPSKTLLGELAMARLAMRPQPPSIAPRPVELPAEPRPVPPPPAGRVDAVNALAECVAIGPTDALGGANGGAAAPSTAAAATKSSAKFAIPAVPTLPPGARKPGSATGSMPAMPAKPIASRTSTSQPALPLPAPPTAPAAAKPAVAEPTKLAPVSGFSKTMTAVPVTPGPSSDTYIAAVPPPPDALSMEPRPHPGPLPAGDTPRPSMVTPTSVTVPPSRPPTDGAERERIISTTISAVPLVAAAVQSAPTDIGGVIVEPEPDSNPEATPLETSAADDASSRTQVHAGAPRPEPKPSDDIDLAKTLNSPPPDMAEIRAEIERRTVASRAAAAAAAQRPAMPEVEISEPTDLTDLPIGPPTPADRPVTPEAVMARAPRKTAIGVAVMPSGMTKPAAATTAATTTAGEPGTDPSIDPVVDPAEPSSGDSMTNAPVIEALDSPGKSRSISVPPTGDVVYDPSIGMPVDISLDASIDLAADDPALSADALAGEEPTGVAERIIVGDGAVDGTALPFGSAAGRGSPAVDGTAPTLPPDGQMSPFRRDAAAAAAAGPRSRTDSQPSWTMPPAQLSGHIPGALPASGSGPSAKVEADKPRAKTPSSESAPVRKQGDWVMSPDKLAGRVPGQSGPTAASTTAPGTAPGPLPGIAPAPLSAIAPIAVAAVAPKPVAAVAPKPVAPPPAAAEGDDEPPVRPSRSKMPSKGDWLIALDPQAPDGWSEVAAPRVEEGNDLPMVSSSEPLDSTPKGPAPMPTDLRTAEPKVQIDPTLIEPLRPMPSDGPLRPMPADNPFRRPPLAEPVFDGAAASAEMPGIAMSMPPATHTPSPQPLPYVQSLQSSQPIVGQAPTYPMDPSYQMIPVSSVAMPRAATAGGSGSLGDAYGSDIAVPSASRRRRMIIIIITAIIAVGIGAFALTRLTRQSAETSPAPTGAKPAPSSAKPAPPAAPTKTSALPPGALPHPSTTTTFTSATPVAPDTDDAAPKPAAEPAAKPAATGCFANVASQPTGAAVVLDQTVLGVTPNKLELPCGHAVDLTFRKAGLISITRSVTATADGAAVRVALARQTFQVKVSSMPAGAVVSQNGNPLGTTPTTIKLNAFEVASLSIAKDGYTTQTESLTPKANGVAVHAVLKKQKR